MKEKYTIEIGVGVNQDEASCVSGGSGLFLELLTKKIPSVISTLDCQPDACDPVLTCDPASWCPPDSHS